MTPPKKRGFLLTRALTVAMLMSVGLPLPARAQFGGIVYDPSNYAQNVLTAARSLQAVNNQIRQIENQAQSLINQAKRTEERRVGKECVSTCRSRGSRIHKKKKKK